MWAVLTCREQAEANADVLQAASNMAAPAATRRTTADMATQYMLGDMDSEPVTACAHEQQTAAKARRTGTTSQVMPSRLHPAAPAAHHSSTPKDLIQAHDYLTTASDRQHEDSKPGMMSKDNGTDIAYSQLDATVTAAEDEASQRQAETKALLAPDSPHAALWGDSPQAAQQSQQAGVQFSTKSSVNTDDISIYVTAGAHELESSAAPASRAHTSHREASGRHAGLTHASLSSGRGGVGAQSPATVRSPLQSVHEEHGTRPSSARASSTGKHCLSHHDAVVAAYSLVACSIDVCILFCLPRNPSL